MISLLIKFSPRIKIHEKNWEKIKLFLEPPVSISQNCRPATELPRIFACVNIFQIEKFIKNFMKIVLFQLIRHSKMAFFGNFNNLERLSH